MNYMKTAMLLAIMTAILVVLGQAIGGRGGAMTALIFAGVMNFVTYWFSDKIVLMMYGAKEAAEKDAPELYRIVRELTMKANMPMPRVCVMASETPNAFATGRNPAHAAVAVTTGIVSILTNEELSGVIAHELSHIRNRDILIASIAATIAGAISYLSHMAYFASLFGGSRNDDERGGGLEMLLMLIVAPIAAMLVQLAISRSREYGADAGGAQLTGNPLLLAGALKKLEYYNRRAPMASATGATAHMFIVSPLSGGSLLKLFSTHPPMEERIKRLEEMAVGRR